MATLVTGLVLGLGGLARAGDEPSATPQTGSPAPGIEFQSLLQAPEGAEATLAALRGKVIVLEFWATWCRPCLDAIPHLNKLANQFEGKPVQFIAVTTEDPAVVTKFLAERRMRAWIGIDGNKTVSKRYGVKSIPRTFLIDAVGKVAGMTDTRLLTAQHLVDLLDGKHVRFPPRRAAIIEEMLEMARTRTTEKEQPLFEFTIVPEKKSYQASIQADPRDFIAKTANPRFLIGWLYDVPSRRVEGCIGVLDESFSVRFYAPTLSESRARQMLRDSIRDALCLSIKIDKRGESVYVLSVADSGSTLKSSIPPKRPANGQKKYHVTGHPISMLAGRLERIVGMEVLDETGLAGMYDYDVNLKFEHREPDALSAELEERFGLKLTNAHRVLEYVVVDHFDDDQ